ncbi:DUF1931 domain-containing protein [Candidatus Woesearchaeota archaeon]|nr:DUF1931 domain-containing protein [Candidatus Woesearchaeota archaeon]
MPLIIVKAQVSELVKTLSKEKGLGIDNVTEDFMPALDKKVRQLVDEAVMRAKENGRKTLMARDV